MPKKYEQRTKDIDKIIRPYIDVYDCPVNKDGIFLRNRKENLNRYFELLKESKDTGIPIKNLLKIHRIPFPSQYTKSKLEDHLNNRNVCYYTSNPDNNVWLLCIDIDAKNGETDAWDIASFLTDTYFNNAYWEPSTGGNGVHLYIFLDVNWVWKNKYSSNRMDEFWDNKTRSFISPKKKMSTSEIRNALSELAKCLKMIVESKGFNAKVDDIKGTPASKDSNGLYDVMGLLVKLPRPQDNDNIVWLRNSPIFTFDHCLNILRDYDLLFPSESISSEIQSISSCRTQRIIPITDGCIDRAITISPKIQSLLNSHNALDRSKGTCYLLCIKLKRAPALEEVIIEYENLGIATGNETPERIKRHQKALDFVSKSYNHSFSKKYRCSPGQYLDLIRSNITQNDIISAKEESNFRYSLTFEDIDCVLCYYVEEILKRKSNRLQFTVSRKGCINRIQEWRQQGLTDCFVNAAKLICARIALVNTGFLERLDENYVFASGKGVSKKYGLGFRCNEYQEYLNLKNETSIQSTN